MESFMKGSKSTEEGNRKKQICHRPALYSASTWHNGGDCQAMTADPLRSTVLENHSAMRSTTANRLKDR